MKTISKLTICMAIVAIALTGCDAKDLLGGVSDAKLSPPSWAQGNWISEEAPQLVIFGITSDDVKYFGISLKIYNVSAWGTGYTLKETKNNSSEYEIKITAKVAGKEQSAGRFHFKKVDANHIEVGVNEDGDQITDWEILAKKK